MGLYKKVEKKMSWLLLKISLKKCYCKNNATEKRLYYFRGVLEGLQGCFGGVKTV